MRILFVFIVACFLSFQSKAAVDVSFESGVPSQWEASNGELKTSNYHYKNGSYSLEWNWTEGEKITVSDLQEQGLKTSEVDGYYDNTFRMWVYNTQAQPDSVVISFLDADNNTQYHYYFYLNFKGWRSVAISYRYEMFGNKASQNLERMIIEAPQQGNGTLYFDLIDYTTSRITSSAPSTHIPYKRSLGDNHWSRMYYYSQLPKAYQNNTPTSAELNDLRELKTEVKNYIKGNSPSSSAISKANTAFNKMNIKTNPDGTISGKSMFGGDGSETENITIMNDIILDFARDFAHSGNQQSRDRFMQLVRHTHDQGYHYGSVLESVHHIGYDFRQYPLAILLMEDELKAEGLWNEAYNMVCWFVGLDGIWEPTAETSNMDAGNTRTIARYCSVFFKDTEEEQVQYLKGFRDYIQTWATPYAQRGEGVKTDYTGFHHNFYYPMRYVTPAYKSLSWVINKIAETSYAVSLEAKEILKKCLLVNRLSTNSKDHPMSIAGRGNPLTNYNSGADAARLLAQAYNPIDQQLASMVNRVEPENRLGSYGAESYPNGFWQLNYGTMGIYRQGRWVANIKGFNNYFLGQEIYAGTSQFSRYAAYGALEILYAGGNTDSGKNINGWDWNITPGATTIHLPLNKLNANGRRDEKTNSEFAGALRFGTKESYYLENENLLEGTAGLFAMDFQQKDLGPNHNPTFRFQKSVFCIDEIMICLGSGITNNNSQYLTATNLFQDYLTSDADRIVINNKGITAFPAAEHHNLSEGNHWLIDPLGTGYIVGKGSGTLQLAKKEQTSRNDSNTSDTKGKFATAYISHGKAPSNAKYNFMVIPNTDANQMRTLYQDFSNTYKIIQNTSQAHAIAYKNYEAYALFSPNANIKNGLIANSNAACMAIANKTDDNWECSINKPLIVFGDNGLAISETIEVTLNGFYELKSGNGVKVKSFTAQGTILSIEVKNAEPVDFVLTPAQRSSLSLPVIHDAYYNNGTTYNNSTLRLTNSKYGYLLFDLTDVSDSIVGASLNLQHTGNNTEASVLLALGDKTNWEETNLNDDNIPAISDTMEILKTTFYPSSVYNWQIPATKIQGKDKVSFIIIPQNDVKINFASKESQIDNVTVPTLKIVTQAYKKPNAKFVLSNNIELKCFPNPFMNQLTIQSSKNGDIELYNTQGRMIYSSSIEKNQNHTIPLNKNIKSGIYILKFKNEWTHYTQRIVKI